MNFEFEQITSRKNPKIIRACSLADKKYRDREGLFAFEGEKLFGEALHEGVRITEVFFTKRAAENCEQLINEAYNLGAAAYLVTEEVYEKLTYEKASQGIFAVARKWELEEFSKDSDDSQGYIMLESVRDPSNVGAILRSCAALGSSNILLSEDCADIFGYKTLRAAMGAAFKANIVITHDTEKSIKTLKERGNVYAAALTDSAQSIAETEFSACDSIIIGNEGHGVSDKVLENCSGAVIIPMQCGSESLNASVAAAILIWERARRTTGFYGAPCKCGRTAHGKDGDCR